MEFDQYASVESRAYGVEIVSKSEDAVTEEAHSDQATSTSSSLRIEATRMVSSPKYPPPN